MKPRRRDRLETQAGGLSRRELLFGGLAAALPAQEDVSIIDTDTGQVVATVGAGKGAWGVVVGQ